MKIFAFIVLVHSIMFGMDSWEVYRDHILEEQVHFTGWCPREKAKQIMELVRANPSGLCVEVGVYGGSSFFPLAATLAFKGEGVAYAIDPWDNASCVEGYEEGDKFDTFWGKAKLDKVLYKFLEDMHRNHLDGFYVLMRMSSAQSWSYFADESIDFLHIDGNHSEQAALFDVAHWLPKVKRGGIVCFDDAWWESTQPAIELLLRECEIMKESSPKWQYLFVRKY